MKEYHAICARGAETVGNTMRTAAMAEQVYVFATHGAGTGPSGYGRILAKRDSEGYPTPAEAPNGFTCVRPHNDNRWEGVPYADLHTALYESCRSVPLFA